MDNRFYDYLAIFEYTVFLKSENAFKSVVPLVCFQTSKSFHVTFLSGWNALYAASFAANLSSACLICRTTSFQGTEPKPSVQWGAVSTHLDEESVE